MLRALIVDELRTSNETDRDLLAKAVIARIDDSDLPHALFEAVRRCVAQEVTRERMVRVKPDTSADAPASSRWDDVAHVLRQRLPVADGSWKLLADCTADDLLHAARVRREHAAENLAAAERFEAAAAVLSQRGERTVGDLPKSVVREVLS